MISVATDEDLKSLKIQDFEKVTVDINAILDSEYMNGHVYCSKIEDRVLACGGVYSFWEGRAEVWLVISKTGLKYKKTIVKDVKRVLDIYACRVARLEAVVDCEYPPASRFIERLGFKLESARMYKYGMNGKDYAMYARVT